ncbi:MAG: hypothetical protein ACJ8F3_19030 [Xanthobacteraceae bacterium]
MTLSRAALVALALVALAGPPAMGQFGGMPGMPGGMPGASPFSAPQQPPPACQELLALRDEVGKHGNAIQAAGKKKAPPDQLCKLFKTFTAAEAKMIKALDERKATCGVPAEVITQVKGGHTKSTQIAKQICDAAAQGPRNSAPSLSDALGTTPNVPDTTATSKGAGTFDTLQGSPLIR